MNRRDLLKASAGVATSLIGLSKCRAEEIEPASDKPGLISTANRKLAGRTLQELRNQYRYDLFDDFLPFMDKHIIDHEFGGFMCNADRDGTLLSTNKNTWYVGRGIWVYSFLYNEFTRDKKHLEVARKAVDFVLRDQPADDELWPAEYTRHGDPIQPKGQYIGGKYVPVSREIYGDLFIANGLAEYSRACGDEQYWQNAKRILQKCIRIYDRPDYAPGAPKVYLEGEGSDLPGVRLLGTWMVLLRLGTQMLAQRPDPYIKSVVDRSLDAIFNHHYNSEYNLFNEVLNHDMSRPNKEYRNLVYTGHGIETMWMVLYEAHRRKDKKLFDKAARMLKRTIEVAWDDVYGGLYRGLKNVDKNDWILDKALWVQEEVLIGTLFIIEHTGAQWAKDWFSKTFNYVHEKFPLKKHGYALWDLFPDRKVTFVEHCPRIGNFHHPRHLMLNLLSIERIIKRSV